MKREKNRFHRIIGIILISLGLILGVYWNSEGFCIGDNVFEVLGLPVWSNGTNGTHYPAVVGMLFILIGSGAVNYTLQEKARKWVWGTVILVLIALNWLLSLC